MRGGAWGLWRQRSSDLRPVTGFPKLPRPLQRLTMFVDCLVNLYTRDIEPAQVQVNGHSLTDRLSRSSAPVRKTGTSRQWLNPAIPPRT